MIDGGQHRLHPLGGVDLDHIEPGLQPRRVLGKIAQGGRPHLPLLGRGHGFPRLGQVRVLAELDLYEAEIRLTDKDQVDLPLPAAKAGVQQAVALP